MVCAAREKELRLLESMMSVTVIFPHLSILEQTKKNKTTQLHCLPTLFPVLSDVFEEKTNITNIACAKSVTFQVVTCGPSHQYSPPVPQASHSGPH